MEIIKLYQIRYTFLKKVYKLSNADVYEILDMWDVGSNCGLSRNQTSNVFNYLAGEGLVKSMAIGGGFSITHKGIKQIEKAVSNPNVKTQYFPPINIINIGHMEHSQVQQNTESSNQINIDSFTGYDELKRFLSDVREKLSSINLEEDDRQEIESDISTLDSQIKSSRPKNKIIHESLGSIKRILESVAGSIITQELLIQIHVLLAMFQ